MGYDTLIIGAGMSGLAAGIRLAQFDRRVLIVERHSLWGGLNSFYKLKGRIFDSGLHALTNYVRKGTPGVPLTRILRQLRIGYDELELGAQGHSEIRFDGRRLEFTNDPEVFFAEIAREFPREIDGFRRLVAELPGYDAVLERGEGSARAELARYLGDPELIESLMLPLCIYGSAREDDLDWDQFVILFRAIFLEGFSRPEGGIKALLELLLRRYKKVGGELRMNCGVERILVRDGAAVGVRLTSGEEILAERVFSSAGHAETLRLVDGDDARLSAHRRAAEANLGQLSFLESISVLDVQPADLGFDATVSFFNHGNSFRYRRPDAGIDVQSGVVCSPNNFARKTPLSDGFVRITALANHAVWTSLPEHEYRARKESAADRMLESAALAIPALARVREHTVFRDTFTPRTIQHYTGHLGGAVYGSPRKQRDGSSGIARLSLVGTDQGMLGIVGAMLSGITIANHQALMEVSR
ncbi:MAG TPA: NAD(P)/FAD-dependent oxidoreductase [Planctomycetota bacterium]|nr:NAD(P)/FAD-dependent oxidoreductase [Planctomycetota bacterium]